MIASATNTLEHLAARAGQLYSLPGVAMQVLQLTRNPHVDTRALKECIENDPAISARILRVVNSSLFGLTREVSDLNQALSLLGIKPLKLLVLGFSLPSGLFLDIESRTLIWFWRHTLTKAVAGRELSQRLWRIPGDEAFLAGLFQDLGLLLLFQQLGQPYARLVDKVIAIGGDLEAIERRALGFSHKQLSAKLLEQWNLPESLCRAVAGEEADDSGHWALPRVVGLAEHFARLLADNRPSNLAALIEAARASGRPVEQCLEPLVMEIEVKVHELADIFSLALPDGLEYRDVLAEAHRQMAHVATQAAEDLVRSRMLDSPEPDEDLLFGELDDLADSLAAVCDAPLEEPAADPLQASGLTGLDGESRLSFGESSESSKTTVLRGRRPPDGPFKPAHTAAYVERKAPPASKSAPTGAAPNLLDRLMAVVSLCRPARRPLSLLLVKLSCGEELLAARGPAELVAVRQALGKVCAALDHPGTLCLPHTDFGFALVLPGAERQQAVELGNDLIRAVRSLALSAAVERKEWLRIDVGVATVALPPRNFPPRDLLDGADRCLYASHASGGGVVKSIEIY